VIYASKAFKALAINITGVDTDRKAVILSHLKAIFMDDPTLRQCSVSAIILKPDTAAVVGPPAVPASFDLLIRLDTIDCVRALLSAPDKVVNELGSGVMINHACGISWVC